MPEDRIARCRPRLCGWEVEFATVDAKQRAEDTHVARWHPGYAAHEAEVMADDDAPKADYAIWETVALDALRSLARSGREFVVFDVKDYGVGEPPDTAHDWGRLTAKARQMGLIEKVMVSDGDGGLTPKAIESRRPETRGSLVKVWRGTADVRGEQGELIA